MEELYKYLGVEVKEGEEPKFDDIKKVIDEKFVHVDRISERKDLIQPEIDKAYGGQAKKIESKAISLFKKNGLDVTHSEMQGYQDTEELLDRGIKMLADHFEANASTKGKPDEKLMQQISDLKAQANQYKDQYSQLETQHNEFKQNVEQEKKTFKVNSVTQDAFGKIKWGKDADDLKKRGFMAVIKDKYKFDLDDDKVIVRNKEGNRVYDPSKAASEPLSVEQVFELEAKEQKVWETSDHNGKKAPETETRREHRETASEKPRRKAHPAFMGR